MSAAVDTQGQGSRLPLANSFGAWVMATRPATLPVAVAPVMVGVAASAGHASLRPWSVVAAAIGALCIQIGTNLANDVFDAEKGVDDERRKGPPRAVSRGLLSARQVKWGMVAAFALATLAGLYLTATSGWVIVLIGVVSILSGIAYTGGPYPLGYNGLGDVFVFVFFGPVAVVGTSLVATGMMPPESFAFGATLGALSTNVLVVNNTRDAENDRRHGKRTLVARFGKRFGVAEYLALLLVAACGVVVGAWFAARAAALVALAPLLLGLPLWRVLARFDEARDDGAALNRCLANSAKLLLLVSAVLSAALLVPNR
jgi:1,4-dihydroxy-2-naphthoate octaprenyltransferase